MAGIAGFMARVRDLPTTDISIGYTTLRFFSEGQLSVGQVGYSVEPNGSSLTGNGEGDWKEDWLVIGYDETCGDPLFTDLGIEDFPVYTAMHGMGDWTPVKVADNFRGFCEALKIIAEVAKGREYPTLLKKNPISAQERRQALEKIGLLNSRSDQEFWELVLRDY